MTVDRDALERAVARQMTPSVIGAKLLPARLPQGAVRRPQLLDRLRGGRGAVLTLISAPGGYGKTTLLSEWVDTDSTRRFAWLTLDARDSEPVRFWTHVIASMAACHPQIGARSLAGLRSAPDDVERVMLPLLFEELNGAEEFVVVLDDFHRAETAELSSQLGAFMRYRPAHVQLVVATRSDPAMEVSRLRASGDLVEVRADALRFDEVELPLFFEGVGVTGLSQSDRDQLTQRTGGWPAPLRLAAILMPEDDRGTFIAQFTGGSRMVVDYLSRDVLDRVEPATRDFLLQVSLLGRLSGSLCDEVLQITGSGDVLARLERANFFVSVDSTGEWYQEHQMFAEALRMELRRTRPDLVPVLHGRAARWLEASGDRESATEHAIAARDLPLASRLVAAQLAPMESSGRGATIHRWLAALSWPEAERDPELAFVRATVAALESRVDDALHHLDMARPGPPDLTDAAGLPLGFRIEFLTGTVAINDVAIAESAARRAAETAPNVGWHGICLSALGQALYLRGDVAAAVETLRTAVSEAPDTHPVMLGFAAGNLGLAECALGVEQTAGPLIDRMVETLRQINAERSPAYAVLHMALGERARRVGDLTAARGYLGVAIDSLATAQRSTWMANAYLLLALAQHAAGLREDALQSLARTDEILVRLPDAGNLAARSAMARAAVATPVQHVTAFGERLSEREVVVLRLAAGGLGQREIAEQLFISYNTVKSHLRAAYRKLGVSSREDAVALLAGLVDPIEAEVTRRSPG